MKDILKSILALILTSLTQGGGEIPPELQTEIDAITAAIDGLDEGSAETPVDNSEAVAEITAQTFEAEED